MALDTFLTCCYGHDYGYISRGRSKCVLNPSSLGILLPCPRDQSHSVEYRSKLPSSIPANQNHTARIQRAYQVTYSIRLSHQTTSPDYKSYQTTPSPAFSLTLHTKHLSSSLNHLLAHASCPRCPQIGNRTPISSSLN